jgi:hypothetical protein
VPPRRLVLDLVSCSIGHALSGPNYPPKKSI